MTPARGLLAAVARPAVESLWLPRQARGFRVLPEPPLRRPPWPQTCVLEMGSQWLARSAECSRRCSQQQRLPLKASERAACDADTFPAAAPRVLWPPCRARSPWPRQPRRFSRPHSRPPTGHTHPTPAKTSPAALPDARSGVAPSRRRCQSPHAPQRQRPTPHTLPRPPATLSPTMSARDAAPETAQPPAPSLARSARGPVLFEPLRVARGWGSSVQWDILCVPREPPQIDAVPARNSIASISILLPMFSDVRRLVELQARRVRASVNPAPFPRTQSPACTWILRLFLRTRPSACSRCTAHCKTAASELGRSSHHTGELPELGFARRLVRRGRRDWGPRLRQVHVADHTEPDQHVGGAEEC